MRCAQFSGSAFKLTRDRAFHHGTLMRQVDMGGMVRYLNPNKAKLQSKGVASVQARVVNLCDLQEDLTHEALSESIMREFQRFHGGSVHAVEDLSHADLSADPALKGYYEELNVCDVFA